MSDVNECKLTGTIDRVRSITTKTGAAMTEVLIKVRQDRFRVVAFGNVGRCILEQSAAGDQLSVTGSLTVSNWKDEATGEWKNSFGVTAWGAEIHGRKVAYQRQNQTPPLSSAGDYAARPNDPF